MDTIPFVEQNNMLFLLGGTVLVVSVVVTTLLIKTRSDRLNWFEQNLVEMSMDAEYYHCKSFNRTDTEDETKSLERCAVIKVSGDDAIAHTQVLRKFTSSPSCVRFLQLSQSDVVDIGFTS
ncbi:unnamed protein product [Heligmosomoides polygyrus]|uniref:Transmembrane protein n=1 Tax=Heligmosomoides polygyrus TaxID=6339 RepID=A0A183F614_HELPZ|nr:unnamed protein product [Heligmosomoides polygyrus]